MKKIISLLITSLIITSNYAIERRSALNYTIKSDIKDKSVKKGYTMVFGKATKNGIAIEGVRISTLNHERSTITKKDGSYSFLVKETDTALYAFKTQNNEIVMNNYNFQGQHKVEINFYLQQNIRQVIALKPIIYLYPEKEITVDVKLKIKGDLTFSYPKYKNSWNVTASPNGTLTNKKRTYPYLFWEGELPNLSYSKNSNGSINGFFIKTDTSLHF